MTKIIKTYDHRIVRYIIYIVIYIHARYNNIYPSSKYYLYKMYMDLNLQNWKKKFL